MVFPLHLGPTTAPTPDPTAPTSDPTLYPTQSPTNEVVTGYWYDDFLYTDKASVDASGTTEVYDLGWYVMNILNCNKHQQTLHFVMHTSGSCGMAMIIIILIPLTLIQYQSIALGWW